MKLQTRYFRAFIVIVLLISWPGANYAASIGEYLKQAEGHMGKGEYSAAVIQLKNALLLEPDNVKVHLLLGTAYLEASDGASAEKEISQARTLGLQRTEWLVPLGRAYLLSGRSQAVLEEITLEEGDSAGLQAEVLQLQGQALLSLKQLQVADEKFVAALELRPGFPAALLGRASIAHQRGVTETVSDYIEQALASEPDNTDALLMKGGLLSEAGKQREAVDVYTRILQKEPENIRARAAKVTALLALGETDKAAGEVEVLGERYPNTYLTYYLRGLVQLQQKNTDAALLSLETAQLAAPSNTQLNLLVGRLHYRKGQYSQAAGNLQMYHAARPDNILVVKMLAVALLKSGQTDKAVEVLEASVVRAPEDAQLLAILGSTYLRTGREELGLEYLDRAVAADPDSAAILTERAIGRLASGDTEQAMSELEGAAGLDEDLVQGDVLLVKLYLMQQAPDKALEAANRLAGQHPDKAMPQNLIGSAHAARKDYTAARKAWQRALELEPEYLPAILNLASIDQLEGNTGQAQKRYQQVREIDPDNLKALIALARLALSEGKATEAIGLLEQACSQHPQAAEPAMMLAELYRREGETAKALDVTSRLAGSSPDNPAVQKMLAMNQAAAGDDKAAVTTLRRLVEIAPSSAEAHYLLAQQYAKQRNAVAAKEYMRQAVALRQDYPAAQIALARMELLDGDRAAAQALAEQLRQRHPEAAFGHELEGDIAAQGNDHAKAAAAYAKAYEKAPDGRLAVKLFRSRGLTGNHKAATASLQDWLEKNPQDTSTRMTLAVYLQQKSDNRAAIEQYHALLEHAPDNVNAMNNLALLYQAEGSTEGLVWAEKAYDMRPQRLEIIDTYGWLLVQNGQHQRGLVLLQEAAALAPQQAEIRYHMAAAMAKVGRKEEARQELERLLGGKDFPAAGEARALLEQLNRP